MEIHKAFSSCEYNSIIEKDFISFLQKYFHTNTKSHLYLFSRHKNSTKLFLLQTKIPSLFKGKYFDINILIYFPNNFPLVPPNFFIEKICNLRVNSKCKFFINEENLSINYEKIINWNNSINCVIDVIEELKKQFNLNFPVVKSQQNLNDNGDCLVKKENIVLIEVTELDKNKIKNNKEIDSNIINNNNDMIITPNNDNKINNNKDISNNDNNININKDIPNNNNNNNNNNNDNNNNNNKNINNNNNNNKF